VNYFEKWMSGGRRADNNKAGDYDDADDSPRHRNPDRGDRDAMPFDSVRTVFDLGTRGVDVDVLQTSLDTFSGRDYLRRASSMLGQRSLLIDTITGDGNLVLPAGDNGTGVIDISALRLDFSVPYTESAPNAVSAVLTAFDQSEVQVDYTVIFAPRVNKGSFAFVPSRIIGGVPIANILRMKGGSPETSITLAISGISADTKVTLTGVARGTPQFTSVGERVIQAACKRAIGGGK